VTGGPLEILTEDVRLDTAAVVVELRAGNSVEVGFGSTGAVRIVPVPAGEWPVRDGRYVPAVELFPASASTTLDAENLRYQRALMGR
jgi:antitoxin (DNA-binding transcriptional repressor) of toxin-antitoxin stability system